jgi:hypothetical protein
VEAAPLTTVLAEAIAEADRRGGSVVIERNRQGWQASIVVGRTRVVTASDPYLENAVEQLTHAPGA